MRKRLGKPRVTVDRELQALHMLGVLDCDEEETEWAGKPATRWYYTVSAGIDPDSLQIQCQISHYPPPTPLEEGVGTVHLVSDTSGTDSAEAVEPARSLDRVPRGTCPRPDSAAAPAVCGNPVDEHCTTCDATKVDASPGRCTHCRYHTQRQGHAAGCPNTTTTKEKTA